MLTSLHHHVLAMLALAATTLPLAAAIPHGAGARGPLLAAMLLGAIPLALRVAGRAPVRVKGR